MAKEFESLSERPQIKRITSKKELKEWLNYELPVYATGIRCFLPIGEGYILRKHQYLLRKAEYYTNTGKRIRMALCRMRLNMIQNKYCIHIPLNCCGKGLRIMHIGPILINGRAVIGENCKFHINTALVAGGTNHDTPVLGNNVVVGFGAVVVGGVRIADNVAIGANAVVNKDVLETSVTVAGVPAKKVSDKGSDAWGRKNNLPR